MIALLLMGVAGCSGKLVIKEAEDLKKIPEARLLRHVEEDGRVFHFKNWTYLIDSKDAVEIVLANKSFADSLLKSTVYAMVKSNKLLQDTKEEDLVAFAWWNEKKGDLEISGYFVELVNGEKYIHIMEQTPLVQKK